MRKKILIMLFLILLGLATAWTVINFELVKEKAVFIQEKAIEISEKIPFLKKLLGPRKEEKPEEAEEKKEEIIEVKAFKVAQIHFTDVLPGIGTIEGYKKIKLRFEVNARIASFNFRAGDLVEEGDIISELEHSDAQLKVKFREAKQESARARMLAAKNKFEQHKKLHGVGAIIKQKLDEIELEYENAVGEYKAAQIELESAKFELEKTYLRSPIDGVLESKNAETGEFVTTNTLVAKLVEISEVYLEIGIIEKNIDRIELGQSVKLKVATYPEEEFTGKIDNIYPTIEGKSRTVTIRVIIKNPYNKLLPGMFARSWITVYEKENAVIAPPMGIEKTEEGYKAFVIDNQNKIHPKIIDVEYTGNPEYWVIAEGLEAGELMVNEVVTGQLSQLKEGSTVEVLETEEYTF